MRAVLPSCSVCCLWYDRLFVRKQIYRIFSKNFMISGIMEFALLAVCSVLLMVMGACEIAVRAP